MPLSSDLRSDYPLNLTLFERPYDRALKRPYRAGLASARRIPVPLTSSKRWFLAQFLVDRAFDAQHYSCADGRYCHSVEPRICRRSCKNFCSSACTPSASVSTYGLTHVRALVRAFRLDIDEQFAHLVEHGCASARGNRGPHSYALMFSLLAPHSALYAVVAVHMLPTAGRLSSITTGLRLVFQGGTRRKQCTSACQCLGCLFVGSRASQINLGGAHDVSKQRSSKF